MKKLLLLLCVIPYMTHAQSGSDYFDANQVKALISPVANHFWDYNESHFYVPQDSGLKSIFVSTFWMGGKDAGGQLHLGAERFRQTGADFLPGPYSTTGNYNTTASSPWDRVWIVERQEIQDWLDDPYQNAVPQSVLDWPAHGDVSLGQAANLAPFVDMDGDGVYDPINDFDYPAIKGDQCVLFLFNDDAILHTESGGQKMGIEVMGMAYGFNCSPDSALNHTLFMEYNVTNRSSADYTDCFVGLWTDFDLGNAQDDYIGCDPTRNLYYVYQGDDEDDDAGGSLGYGTNLPSQGVRILEGVRMDPDNQDNIPSVDSLGNYYGFGMDDGTVDNERLGLSYFMYHNNSAGPTGDPTIAADYYLMMSGHWKDGTQLTYGGNGYDPMNQNAIPARFMFADSLDTANYSTYGVPPSNNSHWTEETAGNPPGDRRAFGSMGPFSLASEASVDFTIAYVFGQKQGDRLGAITKMKAFSDQVQAAYDAGIGSCGDFVPEFTIGIEAQSDVRFALYPNPTNGRLTVGGLKSPTRFSVMDVQGRTVGSGTVLPANPIIDLQDVSPGIYTITLDSETGIGHKKVIVQ